MSFPGSRYNIRMLRIDESNDLSAAVVEFRQRAGGVPKTIIEGHSIALNVDASDCPTLYGERLSLEPLTAAHAEGLFPLLGDDELWRYTEDGVPQTVDALRDRYRRLERRRSPDGTQLWLNWALASLEHGLAGYVQATVSRELQRVEVAYVIGKRFWSLGLGTEAVRVMLAFLRDRFHLRMAVATVDGHNIASLRLLEKLGFKMTDDSDRSNLRLELLLTSE